MDLDQILFPDILTKIEMKVRYDSDSLLCTVFSNPSTCAGCIERPNKLKRQSLEQRKIYCKGQTRRMGSLCSKDPKQHGFQGRILKVTFGLQRV